MQAAEHFITFFRLAVFSMLLVLYLVFSWAEQSFLTLDLVPLAAWLLLIAWSVDVLSRIRARRLSAGICHASATIDAAGTTVFLAVFQAAAPYGAGPFLLPLCRHLYIVALILSLLRLSPLNTLITGIACFLGSVTALLISILAGREIFYQFLYLPPVLAVIGVIFWRTAHRLEELLAGNVVSEEVLRSGRRLRMTLDIIHASVFNLNQFVENLERISATLSSGVREQARSIEYVSGTAGNLQSSMARITESTEVSARTIGRTAEFSESGNSIVHRVIDEILGIHEVVDQMVSSLERIDDLADQTNLLALNAAIEASQAGKEGTGFTVIADEIRKLAEKSARTAGEIGGMVKKVEQVIFSGGESSKEAGKIFDRINKDLGGYSGFIQELHHSVQKLLNANRDVYQSIESIGRVIFDNNQAADYVKKMVGDMKKEVTQLKTLLNGNIMEIEAAKAEEVQP